MVYLRGSRASVASGTAASLHHAASDIALQHGAPIRHLQHCQGKADITKGRRSAAKEGCNQDAAAVGA
jgi:hypothetical protein